MVVFITGASHTGKTLLAQKLAEKYHYPCISADLIKMGLIRSGKTKLNPCQDKEIKEYLWPVLAEMAKTAVENEQNLIIEGIYIPCDWKKYFEEKYIEDIKFICLVMSEKYINRHFDKVLKYSNIAEKRIGDDFGTKEEFKEENRQYLNSCIQNKCEYLLIDDEYDVNIEL